MVTCEIWQRRSADREYVLKVFCKQEWEKLSPEKKSQHQLFNCNGCLNDIELKKSLGFFLITSKFSKVVEEYGIVDNSGNKEKEKENIKNNRTAESVKKVVQELVPPAALKTYNKHISSEGVKDINQTWKSTLMLRNFGGDVSLSCVNRLRMVQQFEKNQMLKNEH